MRNACSSRNTERTTRLISRALARSRPSGFSSTTRTVSPFRPAAPSWAQIVGNRSGLVARYMTTTSAGAVRPTLDASQALSCA